MLSATIRKVGRVPVKQKLVYLEGLRGVAALVVVFTHLRNTFFFSFTDDLLVQLKESTGSYIVAHVVHSFVNLLFNGNLAVYIFWFMSAYVISIKLFERDDRYLFSSFAKRYFRLMLPALASVLVAYLLLVSGLMFNLQVAERLGEVYRTGWLGGHYNFEPSFVNAVKSGAWSVFFDGAEFSAAYNSSLWSMQPELYGSIFCFFLFGIVRSNSYRYIIYMAIICGTFAMEKYWLVTFLLGFFLCDIDHSRQQNGVSKSIDFVTENIYLNIFLLGCIILVGGKLNFFGFSDVFTSSLIVLLVMRTKLLQNLLQRRAFVWLGKISFSLYLIHIPLICSFSCYMYLALNLEHNAKVMVVSVLTLVLALIISSIFEKYVDNASVLVSNKIASALTKEKTPMDS